jgi:hypothetical protein
MHEIEETTYWVEQSSRKRRSGRDIALYADRPSKLTGELDTIHLEIRLQTARSVKANGIHTVDDLLTLDPRVLFERNISIVEFDEAQARKDFIRRNARLERRKHQVSTTAFIDQYRASIPRRLKQIWKRSQCDRVQVYAQHYSIRRMKRLHVFSLPSGLRWGAMKSLGNSGGVQVL